MTAIHDKPVSTPDEVNRTAWSTAEVVHEFGGDGSPLSIESWSDAGERAAVSYVASEARGRPDPRRGRGWWPDDHHAASGLG